MEDKIIYLETKTKKVPMLFSFNVMEEMQNKYGSYNAWLHLVRGEKQIINKDNTVDYEKTIEGEPDLTAVKLGLLSAINEGIEVENEGKSEDEKMKLYTGKEVGRLLTEIGLNKAGNKLQDAVIASQVNSNDNTSNEDLETKN